MIFVVNYLTRKGRKRVGDYVYIWPRVKTEASCWPQNGDDTQKDEKQQFLAHYNNNNNNNSNNQLYLTRVTRDSASTE